VASRGKRPAVRADRHAWEQLGKLLQRRRAQLGGGSQTQFAADHKVSVRRVRDIENASRKDPSSWQIATLEAIAQDYEITYESMLAVLKDEAAELVPAPPPGVPGTTLREPPMADDARADADRPYAEAVLRRLLELCAQLGVPAADVYDGRHLVTGAQMFGPGTPDAAAWDRRSRHGWGVPDLIWMIAELRRLDAPGAPGDQRQGRAGLTPRPHAGREGNLLTGRRGGHDCHMCITV
jgi:hypothetical protein